MERTRKRSEGLSLERKGEKKKEPSVEERLQKLHSEIKFALKVDNPVRHLLQPHTVLKWVLFLNHLLTDSLEVLGN